MAYLLKFLDIFRWKKHYGREWGIQKIFMDFIKERMNRIMSKVYIFFADGFEDIEGLTVVDLLRRAKVPVHMVSIQGKQAKGSQGIVIETEIGIAEVSEQIGDYLVLPGGMPGTLHLKEHAGLCRLLNQEEKKEKHIAAICAAPSVLGELGMLKGKRACCYPSFEEKLNCLEVSYEPVVTDGRITTSRGMGTAVRFSLELVSVLYGKEKADEIAESIVYM